MTVGLKHEQITERLTDQIRAGLFRPGEQLPGEAALAARFGVSRNTVRSALAELADAGLITTRVGKGSYVTFDGHRLDGTRGWAEALEAHGLTGPARTLRIVETADEELARELPEAPAAFIRVERLREVPDGPPVSYERSMLPAVDGLRDLPRRGLIDSSITRTLAEVGLVARYGRQHVAGRPLTADEAEVLGRRPGDWFLRTQRTCFDDGGRFVEHVDSLLDPAHFELELYFMERS